MTVSTVTETWDLAKRKANFDELVGTDLLLKLFELEPRTKKVFHFELDYSPTPQALKESGNLKFAIRMLESFDACISMLGPETEILYEILGDIGRRHVSYGVSPHFFPFFGQAMVYAMGNLLGDKWTPELKEVWLELYDSFSGIMMKAILDKHLERMMMPTSPTRSTTKTSDKSIKRSSLNKRKPEMVERRGIA